MSNKGGMVILKDRLTLDNDARICADGSLVAEVFAARTGLQDYLGREVDPEGARFAADKVVKVYRPESEVFKADSLATFAAAPVTIDHPSVAVTADNWRDLGVGEINGDVVRDGQRVRVPIIIRDAAAVEAATTTHKQLSMGYATKLLFPADGKHPDGTACDAYQTDMRINHIALVRAARGGSELRVVDERAPITQEKPAMAGTIIVDGLPVSLGDEVAVRAVLDKLNAQIADNATALQTAKDTIATMEGEKLVADKALADAKALAEPAAIEKLVADRAVLVDAAKKLKADIVTDGKTADAIRAEVVAASLGDHGLDAAGIAGAFAALLKTSDVAVIQSITPKTVNDNDGVSDALRARNAARSIAYKGAK